MQGGHATDQSEAIRALLFPLQLMSLGGRDIDTRSACVIHADGHLIKPNTRPIGIDLQVPILISMLRLEICWKLPDDGPMHVRDRIMRRSVASAASFGNARGEVVENAAMRSKRC